MSLLSMIMESTTPMPDTDFVKAMNRADKNDYNKFVHHYGMMVENDKRNDSSHMQPYLNGSYTVSAGSALSRLIKNKDLKESMDADYSVRSDDMVANIEKEAENTVNQEESSTNENADNDDNNNENTDTEAELLSTIAELDTSEDTENKDPSENI